VYVEPRRALLGWTQNCGRYHWHSKENCTHYGRVARHRGCNRSASGRGRSQHGHHLHERCRRGRIGHQEIERAGGEAIAIQADDANPEASKAAVEKTAATFGRLDMLVNNAGTAIPKRFEETTLEELDRVIDIDVPRHLHATQAALKHMQSGGRIIMIGSCAGERAMTPREVETWEPGHHSQQYPAGSDGHGFKSRGGRLGRAPKGRYSARPL
jgi:NAD(P)-dependent dehydrogenase (short-subunit alcohol dehydrogenase family)